MCRRAMRRRLGFAGIPASRAAEEADGMRGNAGAVGNGHKKKAIAIATTVSSEPLKAISHERRIREKEDYTMRGRYGR